MTSAITPHVPAHTKLPPLGSTLAEHEHVQIEQTWVIEGHLVDKSGPDEGIECKAGQFIWRPAGSRHSAWSPKGGLMLAFFQIPNKFYADGKVTDMAGAYWEALWGIVNALRKKMAMTELIVSTGRGTANSFICAV